MTRNDLHHERLARGVVQRGHHPAREHERVDHPDLDPPARGQAPQREGGQDHQELRAREQRALGEPVGQHAAPRAEQQDREELQAGGHADGDAAAGELHDQPHLGHDLHPVA
jgi:hypothetical protein